MYISNGDILLTRNMNENSSPGYYNHAAIISIKNWVVESQALPMGVIAVPIWSFFKRYPEILVLRCIDTNLANTTASLAVRYIGRKYSKYMSIRPLRLWGHGDSCISLISRIYNRATGIKHKWYIPDDLLNSSFLQPVALKKNYQDYKEPIDTFQDMITKWNNEPAEKFY